MKKKFLAIMLFMFATIAILCAFVACAESDDNDSLDVNLEDEEADYDLIFELSVSGDSYSVCGITEEHEKIVIPSMHEGVPVTSVGENAFEDCEFLITVTISEGITTVDDYAFSDCPSLENVLLPESLLSIGEYAFYRCGSLSDIYIPQKVETIGTKAFSNCVSMTSVNIPASVTYVGQFAFTYCEGLTAVYITDLYAWCSINFMDGATYAIGTNPLTYAKKLYLNNTLLRELVIPDGITEINGYQFVNCESIRSITVPDGVTYIGHQAFSGCSSVTNIVLPLSLTYVGYHVFTDCDALKYVYYYGEASDWGKIDMSSSGLITTAKICYYREEEPPQDHVNYWHYGSDGKPTLWWVYLS